MPTRERPPGHWTPGINLAATLIVLTLLVAAGHGLAAQGHLTEANEHQAMLDTAGVSTAEARHHGGELAEMAEHATVEARIGWLLWAAAAAGLALTVWGTLTLRRRRRLLGWLAALAVAHLTMLAAGICSRTSVGLLGHTDPATSLWGVVVVGELAVVVGAAACWGLVRGARNGVEVVAPLFPDRTV
jgi:hypothetical protein